MAIFGMIAGAIFVLCVSYEMRHNIGVQIDNCFHLLTFSYKDHVHFSTMQSDEVAPIPEKEF